MKIFIIIAFVAIAVIAGIFLRMAWENCKAEGVMLKYRLNTLPATVVQPFCCAVYFIFMTVFCLSISL